MGSTLQHGGGVDAASQRYRIAKPRWLDLSTGINPLSYPLPVLSAGLWMRLPDKGAEGELLNAARDFYGVPDDAGVVAAPGTQALIQIIPWLLSPRRVCVIGPTYMEHGHCWAAADHDVKNATWGEPWPDDADVVVLVNPNNPDGHRWSPAEITAQLHSDRLIVVDEAFADVTPGITCIPASAHGGLIVLRSFGKFFGLAGLRLGFAVTSANFAASLDKIIGPWAVSGPALAVGTVALRDTAWVNATRARLAVDAERLDVIMSDHGARHLGGTDLFRLYDTGARDLHSELAQQGIWTRSFDDAPGVLRLGVPGKEADFERLNNSLEALR